MELEDFFRQKLENAEIIPDTRLKAKLMSRVDRKEFLRFNPARFNVYYLGLILAALVTLVIAFSGNTFTKKAPETENILPVLRENSVTTFKEPELKKSGLLRKYPSRSIKKEAVQISGPVISPKDTASKNMNRVADNNYIGEVNNHLGYNSVYKGISPELNKIQAP